MSDARNTSLIYLDNASTTWPKPPAVAEAMRQFMAELGANPGRAGHRMAVAAEQMLDDLRSRLARWFDVGSLDRVIFTLNCTDATNIALKGVLRESDHVVATVLEHNSISRPLQAMADRGFIRLIRVGMTGDGFVDPSAIQSALTPRTRLVACTHCSNVLGTVQPIADVGRIARGHGALLLVDAAQSAGLLPIAMRQSRVDLLALAGHKSLLGPMGTGVLCVGERVEVAPWREGGTGGDSDYPVQPEEWPYHLEAGTPNAVGLAGLNAGLKELERLGIDRVLEHERSLARRLTEALGGRPRITLFGPADFTRRVGLVSLTIDGLDPQEAATILDQSFHVAVRSGLHCAPYLHRALGTHPAGTIRVSPGPFTTEAEIDHLANALRQLASA